MRKEITNGFEIVHNLIKLRWVPEILKSIELGNIRYTDILNSICYLSHTELNRKLNVLLDRNVIKRTEKDNIINYTLLGFGEDLVHIFDHLRDIEEKYC